MTQEKIDLIDVIGMLKDNWCLWSCERDGVAGTIEADRSGNLIAYDTFEADE